jgi:hypothetical protein
MWSLITKCHPPTPPQPQLPTGTVPGPAHLLDGLLQDVAVSYCPLLMDTTITNYNWADVELRQTIYRCMYHKPEDRPSLGELLATAKQNVQKNFNETDDNIRNWIAQWFYDAPRPPKDSAAVAPPPPIIPAQVPLPMAVGLIYDQAKYDAAVDDPNHVYRENFRIRLLDDFPRGWDQIFNNDPEIVCGSRWPPRTLKFCIY